MRGFPADSDARSNNPRFPAQAESRYRRRRAEKTLREQLADQIGLARLPGASDNQRFPEGIIQPLFEFSEFQSFHDSGLIAPFRTLFKHLIAPFWSFLDVLIAPFGRFSAGLTAFYQMSRM